MKGIKEPVESSETYVKDNGCLGTRVLHSYVVVLTEKDGANVKAIRIHTQHKKGQGKMTRQIELGFRTGTSRALLAYTRMISESETP